MNNIKLDYSAAALLVYVTVHIAQQLYLLFPTRVCVLVSYVLYTLFSRNPVHTHQTCIRYIIE